MGKIQETHDRNNKDQVPISSDMASYVSAPVVLPGPEAARGIDDQRETMMTMIEETDKDSDNDVDNDEKTSIGNNNTAINDPTDNLTDLYTEYYRPSGVFESKSLRSLGHAIVY